MKSRNGFTLMEVALATLVLVVSALVVLMLLPNALHVQKMSRYKVVASLHAQNLMAHFYQSNLDTRDVQAYLPYQDGDISRGYYDITSHGPTLGTGTVQGCYNLIKRNKMLSLAGEYDFERQIANAFNNTYPVPLSIARRLDSPNDEIKKILDGGGAVFYSDKLQSGLNPHLGSSGQVNSDLQQLIFGVVGTPQQNTLPYNPLGNITVDLYPHPPQGHQRPTDRVYTGTNSYTWTKGATHTQGGLGGLGTSYTNKDGSTTSGPFVVEEWFCNQTGSAQYPRMAVGIYGTRSADGGGGFTLEAPYISTGSGNLEQAGHETADWEFYAHKYKAAADAGHRDHAWFDPTLTWEDLTALTVPYARWPEFKYTSLQAYRDLVHKHWVRIIHQIDPIGFYHDVGAGPGGSPVMNWHWETHYRPVLDSDNSTQRDIYGRVIMEPFQVWVGDHTGWSARDDDGDGTPDVYINDHGIPNPNDGYWTVTRGYPHPATGMGYSLLEGTDIKYDDAFASSATAINQIRMSMPSLERRIKYRTQALILWAKAAYGKDIRQLGDHSQAYVAEEDGTAPPTPAGYGSWGDVRTDTGRDFLEASENPLYRWRDLDGFLDADGKVLSTSADRATDRVHPTQVLALNYLAHAAVMVSGYRPPFVNRHQTLEAADDTLMVPDGDHPSLGVPHMDLPYMAARNSDLRDIETVADLTDPAGSSAGLDPATGRWLLQPALVRMGAGQWGLQVRCTDGSVQVCEVDLATGELQLDDVDGNFPDGAPAYRLHADLRAPADHALYANQVLDASGRPTDRPVVVNVDEHYYLRNPYHRDNYYVHGFKEHGQAAYEVQTLELLERADPKILQTYRHEDCAGKTYPAYDVADGSAEIVGDGTYVPIGFRRHEGGIINNFPPPYADLGAFDAGGNPHYKVTWQLHARWDGEDTDGDGVDDVFRPVWRLLRKICHDRSDAETYGYDAALEHKDTQWMRRAHEAMMRVLMYYVSDNPYDTTVAKPANRQAFIDRGIWQYDLFDASDQAIRPTDYGDDALNRTAFYRINAPYAAADRGDDFRFSVNWCAPITMDSLLDYGEPWQWDKYYTLAGVATDDDDTYGGSVSWMISQRAEPRRTGRGMRFGHPYPAGKDFSEGIFARSSDDGVSGFGWGSSYWSAGVWNEFKYGLAESYLNYVNELHGNTTASWADATGFDVDPPAETGNPGHFLATKPFTAEERTRQLVYWQVDWMQYTDFEEAPSAPVDWSRMNYQKASSVMKGYISNEKARQHNVMGWYAEGDLDNSGGDFSCIRMPGNPARMARFLTNRRGWEDWKIDFGGSKYVGQAGDKFTMSPTDDLSRSYQAEVTLIEDGGQEVSFDWIIPYDNDGDGVTEEGEVLAEAGAYLNQLTLQDKIDLNLADMEGDRPESGWTTYGGCILADTFIRAGGYSDHNFNGTDPMELKYVSGNMQYTRAVYLKFDLSVLPADPDNVQIQLEFTQADDGTAYVDLLTDDNWDAAPGLTWNSADAAGINPYTASSTLGSPEGSFVPVIGATLIDVTDIAKAELAGDGILSVVLHCPDTNNYNTPVPMEGATPPQLSVKAPPPPEWDENNLDPEAEVRLVNTSGVTDANTLTLTAWQFDPVHVTIFDFAPAHCDDTDIPTSKWDAPPKTCGGDKTIWFWASMGECAEGWANPWQNKLMNSSHGTQNQMQVVNWTGTDQYLADSDYFSGNPERDFAFLDPARTATVNWVDEDRITGDFRWIIDNCNGAPMIHAGGHKACPTNAYNTSDLEEGWSADAPYYNAFMQTGYFGADRNRDGQYSRGDVPPSTRMQALEVARFNFYDPVCWIKFGK